MNNEKKIAIGFAEWIEKKLWTKTASLPNNVYKKTEGWYNTHNYEAMKQPLSTDQLFDLYKSEVSQQKYR